MMKHITVLIASDSEIITAGLAAIISGIKDVNIQVITVRPQDLPLNIERIQPKAIILDILSFGIHGFDDIRETCPDSTYIIGYSTCSLPANVTTRFNAIIGINDSAIRIAEVLKQGCSYGDDIAQQSDLTPREKEVIKGIVKGLSNKEIASDINVSVNTVMTHRRNIASKLQIHSPAGLTIYAIVSKLVSIDEIKESIP